MKQRLGGGFPYLYFHVSIHACQRQMTCLVLTVANLLTSSHKVVPVGNLIIFVNAISFFLCTKVPNIAYSLILVFLMNFFKSPNHIIVSDDSL